MKINEKNQLKILNTIQKAGKFLDVKKLLINLWVVFIVSIKGTGKSHSAMVLCIDYMLKKKNWAWIRNTKEELESSDLIGSFTKLLYNLGLLDNYIVTPVGVYFKPDKDEDTKLLMGKFLYMSRPLNSASQNALQCELIVYDEFINPTFHMKNLHTQFCLMCDTLARKKECTVLLLGNKHATENDLLNGFGIEFDWENPENQVVINNQSGAMGYWIGDWKIKDMGKAQQQRQKWGAYNASLSSFQHAGVATSQNRSVYKWELNDIGKSFTPLYKITLQGAVALFGYYKHANGATYLYVKEQQMASEYPNIPHYCIMPYDKESYNVFLAKDNALSIAEIYIAYFNAGKMLYDTAFIKDICRMMLPYIKQLVN